MGNHTIDCDFCGQDQRIVGISCCEPERERRRAEDAVQKQRAKEEAEVLERHGLSPWGLHTTDVVSALRKVDAELNELRAQVAELQKI